MQHGTAVGLFPGRSIIGGICLRASTEAGHGRDLFIFWLVVAGL